MKILVIVIWLLTALNVFAEDFETIFASGDYKKAIEAINHNISIKDKSYYLAICYSRLQEFDKAIPYFEKAIEVDKIKKQDIYYEYGQALYAVNDLKKARSAFKSSVTNEFNPAASHYYIGHISQILEDYEAVITSYNLIITYYSTEVKIKQVAQFQLAETILAHLKDKTATQVDKYVLPLLKAAKLTDPSSIVAQDIDKRYHELLTEYKLDPDLLQNGRRISSRRWEANISQKVKYDQNVTLTNFENNITQTQKKSFIFETEAYYNRTYVFLNKFIVAPEARFTFSQYANHSDSDVYQNDSYILNFSLKNKYEHQLFNRPASMLFDLDYSKTAKDFNKTHNRDAYSKSINFTIGDVFSYFTNGDTTAKLKRKNYDGTDTTINNHTTEISIDQTIALKNQNLLIFMLDESIVDNYNNSIMNTDALLLRVDYLMPELFSNHTLALAIAQTFTNTKLQKATRGTETTFNPSIDLSRKINSAATVSVNYDFTNNKSKSSDYTYKKHVFSLEFKYVF